MRPPLVVSVSSDSVPCEFATRLAVDAGCDVVKAEPRGGDNDYVYGGVLGLSAEGLKDLAARKII